MRKPRALLSLHDVTPAFERQIKRAWSSIRRWGVVSAAPPALLLVPRYHDRYLLTDYPEFIEWLAEARDEGCEVVLHGLTHKTMGGGSPPRGVVERAKARFLTADEGEFQSLPYYRTARALQEGRAIFESSLGSKPEGFVAPAWLESEHTEKALRRLNFAFHEDHLFIGDLRHDCRLLVPAVTFTGRSRPRAVASIGWAKAISPALKAPFDLRLALHPVDFDHDDLVEAIGALVEKISESREWVTYRQLLAE